MLYVGLVLSQSARIEQLQRSHRAPVTARGGRPPGRPSLRDGGLATSRRPRRSFRARPSPRRSTSRASIRRPARSSWTSSSGRSIPRSSRSGGPLPGSASTSTRSVRRRCRSSSTPGRCPADLKTDQPVIGAQSVKVVGPASLVDRVVRAGGSVTIGPASLRHRQGCDAVPARRRRRAGPGGRSRAVHRPRDHPRVRERGQPEPAGHRAGRGLAATGLRRRRDRDGSHRGLGRRRRSRARTPSVRPDRARVPHEPDVRHRRSRRTRPAGRHRRPRRRRGRGADPDPVRVRDTACSRSGSPCPANATISSTASRATGCW